MKKLMMVLAAAFAAALPLMADTETVDGIEWNYTVSDGKATLSRIDQSTTGAITIPSTLGGKPVTSIGDWAFSGRSGLTSVTIPDGVTSIGSYAFYYCSGLTSVTIPNSVTSIGEDAFRGCSGLTSVTIPNSVTNIGNYALYGCSGLMSFVVGSGNANYSSVNGLLLSKDGKTLINGVNGDVMIPNSVTSIGKGAFDGCSGLTSVTIPNSVTSIGDKAFFCCECLTDVTIGKGVTSIGDYAFSWCSGLTSMTIPDSVTSIGIYAFGACDKLETITIPDGLVSVGDDAFGCGEGVGEGCPTPFGLKLEAAKVAVAAAALAGNLSVKVGQSGDASYMLSNVAADRSIASVMVDGDCAIDEFVLKDGKVYDAAIRIVNTSAQAVKVTLPAGYTYETFKGTKPLTIPPSSRNILTITRTAERTFLVSRRELETAQ